MKELIKQEVVRYLSLKSRQIPTIEDVLEAVLESFDVTPKVRSQDAVSELQG